MILMINGWPGVGKLTVAMRLAEKLGARLLDNHTISNVAFRLTEFRSPEFYQTVRAVRTVAFARAGELANTVPIVMTGVYSDGDWGRENWDATEQLARNRGSKFLVVLLECAEEENIRRGQQIVRAQLGKLRDPGLLLEQRNRPGRSLLARGDHVLRVDSTFLSADRSAETILTWIRDVA